jgi:hypothetical protein
MPALDFTEELRQIFESILTFFLCSGAKEEVFVRVYAACVSKHQETANEHGASFFRGGSEVGTELLRDTLRDYRLART